MESQLQGLINQIKEEGIAEARKEASRITAEASERAAAIEAKARQEAEAIRKNAEEDARRFRESSEKAVEQAGRNLVLSLRRELEGLLGSVMRRQTDEALTPAFLKELIIRYVEESRKTGDADVEVLLNDRDRRELESMSLASLARQVGAGIELKPVEGIRKGFMVGVAGGNVHYDITDEGIVEALQAYLNPRLREILEKAK